jgi:hypothetical protein
MSQVGSQVKLRKNWSELTRIQGWYQVVQEGSMELKWLILEMETLLLNGVLSCMFTAERSTMVLGRIANGEPSYRSL